jgi:hypothetical protein
LILIGTHQQRHLWPSLLGLSPQSAMASGAVSGLLALFALRKLKQFVVRAECSYDVMDQEEEDNHAGAS